MYKTICIAVDNSDYSNHAIEIGTSLAKVFGATVFGSHVYAAKMHDKRFKQMEAGLPEEYHDEKELEKQRRIHDTLITKGLTLITDSYLDVIDTKCSQENLPYERKSLEGRNFKVLVEDIEKEKYDLVVLGSLGVGAVRHSTIGSVCERTVRRVRSSDIFVIKNTVPLEGKSRKIVVAMDGSPQAFGGLKTALTLGRALNVEVEVVAAFDPYFHYAAFNSIADVLSEEAGKVFRFKEQEKLHEEIIDSGLAKIYQAHLDISKQIAEEEEGMKVVTALLDGKPFEKVMQYVRKENPWLLVVGRIGVHSQDDGEMDLGSNTENLLRNVGCHVLISNRTYVPPVDTVASYSIAWTEEALRRMDRVPSFARGVAKTAVNRFAIEKGHTIITNSVIDVAMGHILPESAMKAMMGVTKALAEKKVEQEMAAGQPANGAAKDSSGTVLSYDARRDLNYYICDGCGYIAKGDQPVMCPICSAQGTAFQMIDKKAMLAAVDSEGGVEVEKAYDDITIEWTSDARARLREVPSGYIRRRAKAVIEKTARKMGLRTITVDLASRTIVEYAGETSWKEEILGQTNAAPQSPASSPSLSSIPVTPASKAAVTTPMPGVVSAPEEKPAPITSFDWTPEAAQRMERVPEGYMRNSTRAAVEKFAQEKGSPTITLEICEGGIEKAKILMEEAMKNPAALEEILKNLGKKG